MPAYFINLLEVSSKLNVSKKHGPEMMVYRRQVGWRIIPNLLEKDVTARIHAPFTEKMEKANRLPRAG